MESMHESFLVVFRWESVASCGDRLDQPKEALADWDDAKIMAANFNSRALNTLFSVVMNGEFKKISSIETAKEEWNIL